MSAEPGAAELARDADVPLYPCPAEYKFTVYTASVVASACLAAAVRGALPERTAPAAAAACLSRLHQVTDVETVSERHVGELQTLNMVPLFPLFFFKKMSRGNFVVYRLEGICAGPLFGPVNFRRLRRRVHV